MTQTGTSQPVLVLGASANIATMLARHWQGAPAKAWHFIGQVRTLAGDGQIRWQPGDDLGFLPPARAVIALWGVNHRSKNPDFNVNTSLGLQALKIARAVGADRVLLASSAAVYDPHSGAPLSEANGPTAPVNPYGKSKLAMEKASRHWVQSHDNAPALVNLRISNVVGGDSLFGALDRSKNITLDRFASGAGPLRSYITIADMARVLEALLNLSADALPPVLNIAGTTPLAMQDMVRAAGGNITWRPAPDTAIKTLVLDTKRLETITGPLLESADANTAIAALKRLQVRL